MMIQYFSRRCQRAAIRRSYETAKRFFCCFNLRMSLLIGWEMSGNDA